MRIFSLDDQMITDGQNAYHQYRTAMLGGPRSLTYDAGMRRMTGVQVVVGAIIACLEDGIDSEADIITVVSRVSRCRWWTVETILRTLAAWPVADRLWFFALGRYRLTARGSSGSIGHSTGLLAA